MTHSSFFVSLRREAGALADSGSNLRNREASSSKRANHHGAWLQVRWQSGRLHPYIPLYY